MGQCFLYGNGSAGAGLTIVSGLTEPVKPKENMIWVKSDKAGKKYVFAEAAPEAPFEGMIWFRATAAGIITRTDVYTAGAWVTADTYIYLGGKWVQIASAWNGELYDSGNQYKSVTGGWRSYSGSLTEHDDYLYGQSSYTTRIGTVKPIDMSSYTQLHVIGGGYGEYMSEGGAHNIKHTVGVSDNPGNGTFLASAVLTTTYSVDNVKEVVIDISSITGSHYVSTDASRAGVAAGVYITKAWMT